jgi:Tfp pilus assembly protein PilV
MQTHQNIRTKDRSGPLGQVLVFCTNVFLRGGRKGGVNPRRGFTLIETFVATSVLLVSLAGPLSIAAQSLRSAYYARDQVTAFYLAQEALEYIQAKRDQNYLAGSNWLSGLDTCTNTNCAVDFPNFTHAACPGAAPGVCTPLLLRTSDKLFNMQTGNASIFTRTLRITSVSANEVDVKVTVSWVSAGISRSFQLSEHLFNWL